MATRHRVDEDACASLRAGTILLQAPVFIREEVGSGTLEALGGMLVGKVHFALLFKSAQK